MTLSLQQKLSNSKVVGEVDEVVVAEAQAVVAQAAVDQLVVALTQIPIIPVVTIQTAIRTLVEVLIPQTILLDTDADMTLTIISIWVKGLIVMLSTTILYIA
jgi:hypothetical protein